WTLGCACVSFLAATLWSSGRGFAVTSMSGVTIGCLAGSCEGSEACFAASRAGSRSCVTASGAGREGSVGGAGLAAFA
ncbi:hypothetical protein, partial [Mesorhizobium sp. M2D.F.Ca.ET.206.01.1.1]|uniref:hypothetical protein n=1 Tax=Mesorhizobium sp. M2D.F.Ca.ET.206.01.1.1 TaxID=2563939 RepID=UPI001AEE9C3F